MGKNGKIAMYTPAETVKAERAIGLMYKGPKFDGPVRVTLVLSEDGIDLMIEPSDTQPCLRGDVDNYGKTVLDALNKIAWDDDACVQELRILK